MQSLCRREASAGQLQAEIDACFLTGWAGLSVLFPGLPSIPEVPLSSDRCLGSARGLQVPGDGERRAGSSQAVTFLTSPCRHVSTAPLTKGLGLGLHTCHVFPRQSLPTVLGALGCEHAGRTLPLPSYS